MRTAMVVERLHQLRRVALTTGGFLLLCAWPLVLFKMRVFGG